MRLKDGAEFTAPRDIVPGTVCHNATTPVRPRVVCGGNPLQSPHQCLDQPNETMQCRNRLQSMPSPTSYQLDRARQPLQLSIHYCLPSCFAARSCQSIHDRITREIHSLHTRRNTAHVALPSAQSNVVRHGASIPVLWLPLVDAATTTKAFSDPVEFDGPREAAIDSKSSTRGMERGGEA